MHQRDEFTTQTDPFRRELFAHCYRMMGSLHEAEDLVQETMLRAWRGFDEFEGRSSLRTWLHLIATRACLNALESRRRRALPVDLGAANQTTYDNLGEAVSEQVWLQPLPEIYLDPAESAITRARTRLAMIAALHTLSARERAAVILREVLDLPAAEVATALDTTAASVNSSLQRARARLATAEPREDEILEPDDPDRRAMLDKYVSAFHEADMKALVSLLREDVTIEMPPVPNWFAGHDRVMEFFSSRVVTPGSWRLFPTAANGQAAAAAYLLDRDGVHSAHSIHLLTATTTGVQRVVAFRSAGLFRYFGLPDYLGT